MTNNRTIFLAVFIAWLLFPSGTSAGDEIRIAAIFALTGPAAQVNRLSLIGANLAVQELNRTGGVLGRRLKLVELDNQSTPIGAKMAAERAAQLGVTAIVGPAWSSHSMAVAQVAQEQGIPMVTNISTHPDITRSRDYVFRVCFTDDFQGRVMARFAVQALGAETAIIFRDITSDYSIGLSREFKEVFESLGGEVLMDINYKQTQQSFRDTAAMVRDAHPDVFFVPGYVESGTIIREILDAGASGIFLGGDGWRAEDILEKAGHLWKGGYYSTHWNTEVETEPSKNFMALAREHLGISADSLTSAPALAFDAVMLIADALERSGTTDRTRLAKALAETGNFQGVTGTISFNEHGDPLKEAIIIEISQGASRLFQHIGHEVHDTDPRVR